MTKYSVTRNRDGSYKMTHKWSGLSVNMPGKRVEEIEQVKIILAEKVLNHNVL